MSKVEKFLKSNFKSLKDDGELYHFYYNDCKFTYDLKDDCFVDYIDSINAYTSHKNYNDFLENLNTLFIFKNSYREYVLDYYYLLTKKNEYKELFEIIEGV